MAVPKIELREGEKLWFERWTWPDEPARGILWKVDSNGDVVETMPVPEGTEFTKDSDTGNRLVLFEIRISTLFL